ncbi:VCBS repeat-containing protein [Membranihabitans marinus]
MTDETPSTLFRQMQAQALNIDFQNTITNTDELNIFKYRNFYNGGGVAIGDINNDGLSDLYFTANMGPNKLYLNQGQWQFEDISQKAGISLTDKWSTGVVMVDINADGYLDIYVCNAGYVKGKDQKNALFINNGDLTFTESAAIYGLDDNGYTTHAAFFDYDKDGDLDAYILNNSFIPVNTLNFSNKRDLKASDWPVKEFLKGGGDKFLRNDNGIFVDITNEAGIYQSLIGFGLGVTIGDVNQDGYEDIYISNDFYERDYLYINNQTGGFVESLEDYFEHISHSSMGADLRDINNDGYPDIFVSDMMPNEEYRIKTTASFDDVNLRKLKLSQNLYHQYMHNTLQINTGEGKFKDIGFYSGTAATDWSWGALLFDADNDGWSDLYVSNGVYHDVIDLDFMDFFANEVMQQMALTGQKEDMQIIIDHMPSIPLNNPMFRNIDGLSFVETTKDWGLNQKSFSNGAAYGDLDNDGDYDLVVNTINQDPLIYQNQSQQPALSIKIKGHSDNPFGIGTKVYAYTKDKIQFYEIQPSRGFQSSVDYSVLFGPINNRLPDSIIVVWPDLTQQTVTEIKDFHLTITYQANQLPWISRTNRPITTVSDHQYFRPHIEDDYTDFYHERGLYRMVSKEGPAVAQADINGDGLLDIFIGGGHHQAGQLYLAHNDAYTAVSSPALTEDAAYEDTYAIFEDIDLDGDYDLIVGSGGNHLPPNHSLLVDRIYLNDGHGNLSKSDRMPIAEGMNTATIVSWDYDADGDPDLFIGSRSVPMHFGYSPLHFLLENDGQGHFKEVSQTKANNFKDLEMVTSALSIDLDNDSKNELIAVGEWMSPKIYSFSDGLIQNIPHSLDSLSGWYYCVESGDIDGDGNTDLILGNHGSNSYLESRSQGLWQLWINDFDNNGFVDKIFTYEQNNKQIPMHQKRDLTDQIISLKKQNLKHIDYANRDITEILDQNLLSKSKTYNTNYRKSYIAKNLGNFQFKVIELPTEAQLSSIHAIMIKDIDDDSDLDIIAAGNDCQMIPQLSRLDGNFGWILRNEGRDEWKFIPERETGIRIRGEVKKILELENGDWAFFINNDSPAIYRRP